MSKVDKNKNQIQIKPVSAPLIKTERQLIKTEKQLYFNFSLLCDSSASRRILDNNSKYKKLLLSALLEFTELFKNKDAPNSVGFTKDYKKLKGTGIKGYPHKFKLNPAVSVLVKEQPMSDGLLIDIGEIGDFHN